MEVDRGTARFGSPHGSEAKYARAIGPEYRPLAPTVQLIFSLKQLRIEDLGANKLRNNADELWPASIHQKNHQERGPKPRFPSRPLCVLRPVYSSAIVTNPTSRTIRSPHIRTIQRQPVHVEPKTISGNTRHFSRTSAL